uniref:Uncharacterized protein n=1 Tax=Sphaerodactylus townsendi TaxID=933632 RepID=A0ACB8EC56_9SAUR
MTWLCPGGKRLPQHWKGGWGGGTPAHQTGTGMWGEGDSYQPRGAPGKEAGTGVRMAVSGSPGLITNGMEWEPGLAGLQQSGRGWGLPQLACGPDTIGYIG